MSFYIIFWIYLLLCSLCYKRKLILKINVLILSVIAGLRAHNIGTDTYSYLDIFNYIKEGNITYIEPGWHFLNKLIVLCGFDYNVLLWLVSILTLLPLVYLFRKYSINPNFSLFIYYSLYAYCNSFNGMRQFLAISIIFLSYIFFLEKKIWKYILSIIFALSIHISSFLGLIVIVIKYINLTFKKIVYGIVVTLFLGCFINQSLFSILLGPYSHYLESDNQGFRENSLSSILLSFIVGLIFILLYYTSKKEFRNNFWVKLYYIGLLMMNLTVQLSLGTRAILYFTLLQTIVYPLYLKYSRIKEKRFVLSLIIVYLGLIFLKILILGNLPDNPGSIIPYKSILTI